MFRSDLEMDAKVHSFISARIPVMIANTSCQVQVEIVKENIPLLLSKDSLKKAGTVLDIINDKAIMFGKDSQIMSIM